MKFFSKLFKSKPTLKRGEFFARYENLCGLCDKEIKVGDVVGVVVTTRRVIGGLVGEGAPYGRVCCAWCHSAAAYEI